MLRDPADQTVSYYLQILEDEKSPVREVARALGFKEFLRRHWTYAMSQTVTLAVAISAKNDPILPVIERRAWQVRAFLDGAFFVGVLERAAESHALLSDALGLETPLAPAVINTAAGRGVSAAEAEELGRQYNQMRNDPATAYWLAVEQETYRKRRRCWTDGSISDNSSRHPAQAAGPPNLAIPPGWLEQTRQVVR